jgi:hypothetical protein
VTVSSRYFDVVVLGRSIGALAVAALLARRDFTVLVLGQGARAPSYVALGRSLRRRMFTMLAGTSPPWRRIVTELAQSQTWKQRAVWASPMLQLLAPRRRLDIPPDMVLFGRELEREVPEVRRHVEALYEELARVNTAADEAFEHDALWPPGTFWERRETERYAAMLPYVRAEPDADLLSELPKGHVFRHLVAWSVRFATDLASPPPPFAVARLHGAWTRGLASLPGGEAELEEFLLDRVRAYGGICLLDQRVESLEVRRSTLASVLLDGDVEPTGAGFLVSDGDGESLAVLAGGKGIHKRALREWPRVSQGTGRFVVSIVARREGVPAPLGPEVLVLPRARGSADPRTSIPPTPPVLHLQRFDERDGTTLLVVETLLPDRGPEALAEARAEVLATLCRELPFLERHLLVVDSPHDGLPVWSYEGGARTLHDRVELELSARPEPMERLIDLDPPGYLGIAGEPIRGPIERTLLVGRTVLPGLGQEGQLLAALGAARLVTRSDRRKARMRQDMWSKIEIG